MRKVLSFVCLVGLWCAAIAMVGCDRDEFQKEHPIAAEAIEGAVDVAEEIAESQAEQALNLPENTLNFDIDIFKDEPKK